MQNNSFFLILFFLMTLTACQNDKNFKKETKRQLDELDQVLRNKAQYESTKEIQLNTIKQLLPNCQSPEEQYNVLDRLYGEYYYYNNDSAFLYANIKRQIATEKQLKNVFVDSNLDWVEIHLIAGMYKECFDILNQVVPDLSDTLHLTRYYYLNRSLYRAMASVSIEDSLKQYYTRKGLTFLEKRKAALRPNTIDYFYSQMERLQNQKQFREAIALANQELQSPTLTLKEKAVAAYLLGSTYDTWNKTEEAVYYYASSAIYDVKIATHKHSSLQRLAELLFAKGEIERAYIYMNYAMNDALCVNSRVNIHYISQLLPLIQQAHDKLMEEKRIQLHLLITIISVLLVTLLIAVYIVHKSKKKVTESKLILDKMNAELLTLNEKLTAINLSLTESNNIKEAYIGYYMDLCSAYMNKVEEYRNELNQVLRTEGMNALTKVIRQPSLDKDEIDHFYQNFDVTFLKIYPNFVNQFNDLLLKDKQIELKNGELLNTELRVFALIRLGINDSLKIAEFLRRSPSTIYNYRVKYRNGAVNNRDDFENQVRQIG